MPDHWFNGDPWTLDSVIEENKKAREAMGLRTARDIEKEMEASPTFRVGDLGFYNKSIYVGVDLGKKADYSALIFAEPFYPRVQALQSLVGGRRLVYHVSRVKRIERETPYPVIARLLKKAHKQLLKNKDFDYVYYCIDEGGVGAGVTDQVVELIPDADVYRCTLTGGVNANWKTARDVSIPKPQMASTLIALFESNRIFIGKDDNAAQVKSLRDELLNYELKVSQAGHDQYGAMKTGEHDDIVTAIGLALWVAEDSGGGSTPMIW